MTYPWDDFVEDYNAWLARIKNLGKSETLTDRANFELAADAFRERYSDKRQRQDRLMRFGLIMGHVSTNNEDYEVGIYGIANPGGSSISWPLMRAAHSFFADKVPDREPSPELVLHRAREYRDEKPT